MTALDLQVRATLKRGAETPAFGAPVSLGATGLSIVLDVPPGVEIERAELRVEAPDDSVELDLAGSAAAVVTSEGPLDKAKSVAWLSADWGARRPLTLLKVTSGAKKGLLKIAEGGPWFPPIPFDVIDLNGEVRLSGVTATRLLVEPLDEKNEKAAATFAGIVIKVGARPPDLSASIGREVPFFQHPLLLGRGEVLVLRDELTGALRRAWPMDLGGGAVSVTLRSSAEARLHSVRLSLATSLVIRAWEGGAASSTLSIPPGGSAEATVLVPPGRPLQSFAFTVQSTPRPEAVPLLPEPRREPLAAHLAGAGFSAAQAFSTPAETAALVGIDLYLQPLTRAVQGTVSIYPDVFGRPADAPFDKAIAAIALDAEEDPPWPARWVSLDLPATVPVADRVFWAVLDIPEGEALWLLGEAPGADPRTETAPRGALFRSGGDRVWREREPPPASIAAIPHPSAYARPRLRADTPPPAPEITVQWGAGEVRAPVGEGGRVTLDASALPAPPPDGDARIHVIVRSAVAAQVTLSSVLVRVPSSQEHPSP